jgi:Secretion system C-terminal sorting domain
VVATTNPPTKYAYPARPNDTINWNMPNSRANTIEKSMVISCGPFKMLPGSRHRLAFAVVADLDAQRHPRVDISKLISRANSLQNVCTFPTAANDLVEKSETVSVVPNPVSNEAQIIYSGFINRVAIFNLTGQLMLQTNDINSNVLKFSTQGMNAGIYVYRMMDNNGKSVSGRFTVVK